MGPDTGLASKFASIRQASRHHLVQQPSVNYFGQHPLVRLSWEVMVVRPQHRGKQPCTLLSTLHQQALLRLIGYPVKAICPGEKGKLKYNSMHLVRMRQKT